MRNTIVAEKVILDCKAPFTPCVNVMLTQTQIHRKSCYMEHLGLR